VIGILLEEQFPPSLYDDILAAVGRAGGQPDLVAEGGVTLQVKRRRDPSFRRDVLRAYEHRCAVTGFRAALGGAYLAVDAAHVRWHAYEGPDIVANGLALEPTLHKLFDLGAWSLTDDRRILVSAEFTGTDIALERLRALRGKPLTDPLPGAEPVGRAFIRWHREPDQGAVFRGPALPN